MYYDCSVKRTETKPHDFQSSSGLSIFNRGGDSHVFVSLIKLTRAVSEKGLLCNAKTALGTERCVLFGLNLNPSFSNGIFSCMYVFSISCQRKILIKILFLIFVSMVNVSRLRWCIVLINKETRSNHCELNTLLIEQHLNLGAGTTVIAEGESSTVCFTSVFAADVFPL